MERRSIEEVSVLKRVLASAGGLVGAVRVQDGYRRVLMALGSCIVDASEENCKFQKGVSYSRESRFESPMERRAVEEVSVLKGVLASANGIVGAQGFRVGTEGFGKTGGRDYFYVITNMLLHL